MLLPEVSWGFSSMAAVAAGKKVLVNGECD
jgi:hypothetical protein